MAILADPTGGVTIGVDNAHYAILIDDSPDGNPVYEEPKALLNTKSIVINSSDSAQTEYYDNEPRITAISKSEKTVAFTKSDLSNEEQRALLGHKQVGAITTEGGDSVPPYVAFGFRTLKSNVHYRYVWLLKGMFSIDSVTNNTREQNTTFQNQGINGTFITRLCDGQIKIQVDSDDPDYTSDIGDNWFTLETLSKLYDASVQQQNPIE